MSGFSLPVLCPHSWSPTPMTLVLLGLKAHHSQSEGYRGNMEEEASWKKKTTTEVSIVTEILPTNNILLANAYFL